MKLIYITAKAPWGRGETFILEEMLEVKRNLVDLLIIPRNPPNEVFHKEAKRLLGNAIWLPLINSKILISFLISLFISPLLWVGIIKIILRSRSIQVLFKNLAVIPKGAFIAKIIQVEDIKHIHAHWGSTTSTMAYIISWLTGITWSFTLHRWDIKENNMLKEKVSSAKFVRCISEHGKNELIKIVGEEYKDKIKIIYMGVKILNDILEVQKDKKIFTIVMPANLLEVKGHKYLIDACSDLVKQGIRNFQCIFYGEGPLRSELESLIQKRGLTNYIEMPGVISHKKLIEIYKNKEVDIVILPSIITKKGEHEGIPVALMEAMAYGIPVISTNTGGIPELLSNGAGIIVEEKSSEQLAEAILKIMRNKEFKKELTERGYQKIQEEFNIEKNVKTLLELIQKKI